MTMKRVTLSGPSDFFDVMLTLIIAELRLLASLAFR